MKNILFLLILININLIQGQNLDSAFEKIKEKNDKNILTHKEVDSVIRICTDNEIKSNLLFYKSNIYFDIENYSLQIVTLKKIVNQTKDLDLKFDILNNIATGYLLLEKHELAKQYFNKALKTAYKLNDKETIDFTKENIFLIDIENNAELVKDYENFYFNRNYGNDFCKQLDTQSFIVEGYIMHNDYKNAVNFLNKTKIDLSKCNECLFQLIGYYNNRATIAMHHNNFEQSITYLNAIPLNKIPLEADKIETYKLYTKSYKSLKNTDKFFYYSNKTSKALEENLTKSNLENLNQIETIHAETVHISKKKNLYQNLLKFGIPMLIAFGIWIFFLVKIKKKLNIKNVFYKDKYHSLWTNYKITNEQLISIKKDLANQSKILPQIKPILNKIKLHTNSNIDEDHKHFDILKNTFFEELNKNASYLNDIEKLICFYLKLELSHKKIAELLNKSEKSINSYKYRINNKVKEHKNTNLDLLLMHLKLDNYNFE